MCHALRMLRKYKYGIMKNNLGKPNKIDAVFNYYHFLLLCVLKILGVSSVVIHLGYKIKDSLNRCFAVLLTLLHVLLP